MTTADLLLHPVRLRVIQALLGEPELTTTRLRERLPDVSTATLYRQVATLLEAQVLVVSGERRVRGAVERSYRLRGEVASVSPDRLAAMSPDEHRAAFVAFVAGLLAEFDRYLEPGDVDLVRDGVGYRTAGFYADDAELAALGTALAQALGPLVDAGPAPGRRRRLMTTVVLPADREP